MAGSGIVSNIRIVLCRPKSPGNVGSVARAMKNMGFTRLVIADPLRYDDPGFFTTEARRMAWGAADLIDARQECGSIDAAIADAVLVVGTTARPPAGRDGLPPERVAARVVEAASAGQVALLFGQEESGLTHDVLSRCQILGCIPATSEYLTLNLAQAALIFLYEIRLATLSGADVTEPLTDSGHATQHRHEPGPHDPPTQGEIDGCFSRFVEALAGVGFFEGTGRSHMVRELRAMFGELGVTRRRLTILEGMAHRIRLACDRSGR